MSKTADFFVDEDVPRACVALLLEHFPGSKTTVRTVADRLPALSRSCCC